MYILGISAFYHDSAACLIHHDKIIAAAQEERFTRKKHDAGFPSQAIKFCLDEAHIQLTDLQCIVFYDKPFLKFERLLETYYAFAPKGWLSFLNAVPIWAKEKLFLKKMIREALQEIEKYNPLKIPILFPEHHLSHAASAYFPSAFQEAAILTVDGVGEWATASIAHAKNNKITFKKVLNFPHSLGLFYSAFTYYLGFKVNSGEYKMMGLAPYGDPESMDTHEYKKIIKQHLIQIQNDGSLFLPQKYYSYATGLKMVNDKQWQKLFGFARRNEQAEIVQHHCNLALAVQQITEEVMLKMVLHAKELIPCNNLCLAGGVALNCVANGKILNQKIFENTYVQPAAGDAGGALGAALAAYHIYFENDKKETANYDNMQGSYLGNHIQQGEILKLINKHKAPFYCFENKSELYEKAATLIAEGKVLGWVQGKMEFGPRALGNRSIIADATQTEMQKKINLKIKFRESFRPFAPAVLAEDATLFFDLKALSPYMLFTAPVSSAQRVAVSENYNQADLKTKLYTERSKIQAVTHVDFSARVQTVHHETNAEFHALLTAYKKITGKGILVNTSFNVRGEPIVCSAEDAYRCFMRTDMDVLVIENYLFFKSEQAKWEEEEAWKEILTLD